MFAAGCYTWAWLILLMQFLSPLRNSADLPFRVELAKKISASTATEQEQKLLVSIANHETSLQPRLASPRCECKKNECDGGKAKGSWQIIPRDDVERQSLCVSIEYDISLALYRIRESVKHCKRLPEDERLAIYARGSCSSAEGRQLSKAMWVK